MTIYTYVSYTNSPNKQLGVGRCKQQFCRRCKPDVAHTVTVTYKVLKAAFVVVHQLHKPLCHDTSTVWLQCDISVSSEPKHLCSVSLSRCLSDHTLVHCTITTVRVTILAMNQSRHSQLWTELNWILLTLWQQKCWITKYNTKAEPKHGIYSVNTNLIITTITII